MKTTDISQRWLLGMIVLTASLLSNSGASSAEVLTLEQALAIAFEQSPEILRVENILKSSQNSLEAEQARLKSRFDLTLRPLGYSTRKVFIDQLNDYIEFRETTSSASFTVTQPIRWTDATLQLTNSFDWRRSSSSAAGGESADKYYNEVRLSFQQPLFTYNRTQMNYKELELSLERSEINFGLTRLNLELQVTNDFLNLFAGQRRVEIGREDYDRKSESYLIAESKVEAGIIAPEELYQARLTQANAEAELLNRQASFETALDNFKIKLGLPLSDEMQILASIEKRIVEVDQEKALAHAIANRMELRLRDISIQFSQHSLVRTNAENEFNARLDLNYGLSGESERFVDIYDSSFWSRAVGVTVNIPLIDWGQKKHSLAARQAELANSRLDAREESKLIKAGIRAAYRTLENDRLQIGITEQSVENAQRTYDINLERYRNGDLSSKLLGDYQTQLANSQLSQMQALIGYRVALLDMKIKSLWDFENNEPIIPKLGDIR